MTRTAHDLLCEIFTEELPPTFLRPLAEKFCNEIKNFLTTAELNFSEAIYFATPRRLAVLIKTLEFQQHDKLIERKGPALDKAYDASGQPTPACLGFARSAGVDVSELIKLPGNYVGCKQLIKGKTIFELIPQGIQNALQHLPIAKPMRWGNHSQKFIRPVHNVLLMYGNDIVPANILGCDTNHHTYGHRFLHPGKITIKHPNEYVEKLKKAFVIVDFDERKKNILEGCEKNRLLTRAALIRGCDQISGADVTEPRASASGCAEGADEGFLIQAIISPELLNEVTSLVEWPVILLGHFDSEFLKIPEEALISAMEHHQRYFPVKQANGNLLPSFIIVSNIPGKNPAHIIAGNERVLRARLSDAKFFFEMDQKISLTEQLDQLKHILFQQKLGSLYDKTERLKKISKYIAHLLPELTLDINEVETAALYAKCDLTTQLVGEFPELQGIAGYYYVKHAGKSDPIAIAIREHYQPRFSGDVLPASELGCVLALADRLDTLVGIFGIHQAPTGDKDPFGLRRAALSILRILIEKKFNLDLRYLITQVVGQFNSLPNQNTVNDVLNFMIDRLKPWYQEQAIPTNVISAVLALNLSTPYDIDRRIKAVMAFKDLPEAEALSIANKRVNNILEKYPDPIVAHQIEETLFESDFEKELVFQLHYHEKKLAMAKTHLNYENVLTDLATLRTPVDNFFDKVLVMTEDKAKRENRLLMLKKLRELFLHVADIALLQ